MSTLWYLWPVNNDPDTNEYFAKIIGEQNPECEHKDVLCADGVSRDLYQCPGGYENVRVAIAGLAKFNLKFEIYKEETEGPFVDMVTRFDLWKASLQNSSKTSSFLKSIRNAR